jgi:NmrA-like family
MQKTIIVAGATGNLGGKIVDALLLQGAKVKALVRQTTDSDKIKQLEAKNVTVCVVDMQNKADIAAHCVGADCVVSALAGLHETILDTQTNLLDAAVAAKVPRFIPSDFAIDFTNLVEGQNRNLDMRRAFHTKLDQAQIQATSIFNGPFMDLLMTDMPLILFKQARILCWGDPNQIMEFTTTQNIASFTAAAAMDSNAPRFLRIAGDRLSCNDFVSLLTQMTGENYKIFRPGSIGLLNFIIKALRFFGPAKNELYPVWQGMQYMRDMMEGRIIFQKYDNDRYPNIKWTSVKSFLLVERKG